MLRNCLLAIFFVACFFSVAFAQSAITAPSKWVNERGSVLTIEKVEADGTFRGTFVNKADGSYCKNDPYLAEGKIDSGKVYFSVAFADRADLAKNCMTVTEWRGTVSATAMTTAWSLAYPGPAGLVLIGGADKFDLTP